MSEISFIDYNIIKIIFFIKDVWSNSQTRLQKRLQGSFLSHLLLRKIKCAKTEYRERLLKINE